HLSFEILARDPLPPLEQLASSFRRWGDRFWTDAALAERARLEVWDHQMRAYAAREAQKFRDEVVRIESGLRLLRDDAVLLRAFRLANRSFATARAVRHTTWRAFQIGYFLSNAAAIHGESRTEERSFVDTLWFPTGGGKTETYLLFVLTAAFYDRMTGKREGTTSWGRFPLRMLSLQ